MEDRWADQPGPVLLCDGDVVASFGFTGTSRSGGPWQTSAFAVLCRASEEPERAEARVAGFVRAARRVMSDSARSTLPGQPWFDLGALRDALREVHHSKRAVGRTPEECEASFLRTRALREHLQREDGGEAAVARLDAWVEEHRVLASTRLMELALVPDARWPETEVYSPQGVHRSRHGLHVTMRLVVYEPDVETFVLRDVKEQAVLLAPVEALGDLDRLIAFLDGWASVLPRLIEERVDDPGLLMPHDFLDRGVLALKRPRTADDFAAACARRWKVW